MYYGIGCEPHTFKEIGAEIGLTVTRIQQIVAKSERKLKKLCRRLRPENAEKLRREEQAFKAECAERQNRNEPRYQYVWNNFERQTPSRGWLGASEPRQEDQVEQMKWRLRMLSREQLFYLKDWLIENKLDLMLKEFGFEFNGGKHA